MRLFSTFLSHLYLFRPAPTRRSTHLFSTYAPVYIYVCLSLYKSIRAVLSLFVASIPYLSYSSTHRSLRFPFELSPRFSPWLVYFSIAPFSCSRAIRPTRRSISSIEIPTIRIRIFLSLLARVECERVYIYGASSKNRSKERCRTNRNELPSVCRRLPNVYYIPRRSSCKASRSVNPSLVYTETPVAARLRHEA